MLGSPWGHVSPQDLVHWQEHPCPLDLTEPWACCLGTDSLAWHDGTYHLVCIKHDRRAWFKDTPYRGDGVFMVTSHDGIHFHKQPNPLFAPGFFQLYDVEGELNGYLTYHRAPKVPREAIQAMHTEGLRLRESQ